MKPVFTSNQINSVFAQWKVSISLPAFFHMMSYHNHRVQSTLPHIHTPQILHLLHLFSSVSFQVNCPPPQKVLLVFSIAGVLELLWKSPILPTRRQGWTKINGHKKWENKLGLSWAELSKDWGNRLQYSYPGFIKPWTLHLTIVPHCDKKLQLLGCWLVGLMNQLVW